MLTDSGKNSSASSFAAHPDDIDFSAAGTVALWTDAGIEVTYCLVTDGDAAGFDETVPRTEIAPLRRKEQTAAAEVLGVHDLRFLGYPDGRVEPTLPLRKDLARVIRQVRPEPLAGLPDPGTQLPAGRGQPSRSPGRGVPRPWTRSTPTPATRSPGRNCWPTKA